MRDGFIKVAAGTPQIRVADCRYNAEQIFTMMRDADQQGVRVLCLPELCLTGSTCGDLFLHDTLLQGAEEGLATILEATKHLDMVAAVGLPVRCGQKLFNCAAVISRGQILGLIPKLTLANHGEYAEGRWFTSGRDAETSLSLCGQQVPLGANVTFACDTMPNLILGVELGQDLWAMTPPSTALAAAGATLILNPSATCEMVGASAWRQQLTSSHSARLICGYVCAEAGEGESTTDLVYAGHHIIAENGDILNQSRFTAGLTVSEVDVDKLVYERRRSSLFTADNQDGAYWQVPFTMEPSATHLTRSMPVNPFVPEDPAECKARCNEMLYLAALGLKKRLEHTHAKTAVVGLSGGLDSTLAILTTALAMTMLGRPSSDIIAVTMPCFGTTDRTRDNAVELAGRLGATLKRIDIGAAVQVHFQDIGQPMDKHDVTFENGQARERTQVLMDIANQNGGLVIGTGDLSELALGWATYNGDHMSMYAVNADIPKTLVRHLVSYVAGDKADEDQRLSLVLEDILDTPVSPELLPAVGGKISQRTEELVGPYELHDFFLYYILRWGFSPRKVYRLAQYSLGKQYDDQTLLKWLNNFYRRFFTQQFKRSCLPDGPKVGSVGVSPRGDWKMPSDAVAALWMAELETLS